MLSLVAHCALRNASGHTPLQSTSGNPIGEEFPELFPLPSINPIIFLIILLIDYKVLEVCDYMMG